MRKYSKSIDLNQYLNQIESGDLTSPVSNSFQSSPRIKSQSSKFTLNPNNNNPSFQININQVNKIPLSSKTSNSQFCTLPSPKSKAQKIAEFRRESKQIMQHDLRDLQYQIMSSSNTEFNVRHFIKYFITHFIYYILGIFSYFILCCFFKRNELRNMRIFIGSGRDVIIGILVTIIVQAFIILWFTTDHHYFGVAQFRYLWIQILLRSFVLAIRYAYTSPGRIQEYKERRFKQYELNAEYLITSWIKGDTDVSSKQIQSALRTHNIEGKLSKIQFISKLRHCIKTSLMSESICKEEFQQNIREGKKKYKNQNRQKKKTNSKYSVQDLSNHQSTNQTNTNKNQLEQINQRNQDEFNTTNSNIIPSATQRNQQNLPPKQKHKQRISQNLVLLEENINIEDLNSKYEIQKLAKIFYYGSLATQMNLYRVSLTATLINLIIVFINPIVSHDKKIKEFTTGDIMFFILAICIMIFFTMINTTFLFAGVVDSRRKRGFMVGLKQMLVPGKYFLKGLVGLVPTANIFQTSTLVSWYELRVILMQIGKKYRLRMNAYIGANTMIGLILGLITFLSWWQNIDLLQTDRLCIFYLNLVNLIIFFMMFVYAAQCNAESKASKTFLLQLKRLAFGLKERNCINCMSFQSSALRHMVQIWKFYNISKDDLQKFIQTIDMVIEQLDHDYEENPLRVLGIKATFGVLWGMLSFLLSIIGGVTFSKYGFD